MELARGQRPSLAATAEPDCLLGRNRRLAAPWARGQHARAPLPPHQCRRRRRALGPGGMGGGERPRRAVPGAQRALWRVLRLAARRLCRQIRRRRRRFGGVPGAEAARQGEAVQSYCNNKPAAGASEGTGTATALPPSLLCACPEHSRKRCPPQPRGAHEGPCPSCSGLPAVPAPARGKPEPGVCQAGGAADQGLRAGECTRTGSRAQSHARTRTLSVAPARALTHTARAAWWVQPETLSPRASYFPQGFQSSHAQLSNFP